MTHFVNLLKSYGCVFPLRSSLCRFLDQDSQHPRTRRQPMACRAIVSAAILAVGTSRGEAAAAVQGATVVAPACSTAAANGHPLADAAASFTTALGEPFGVAVSRDQAFVAIGDGILGFSLAGAVPATDGSLRLPQETPEGLALDSAGRHLGERRVRGDRGGCGADRPVRLREPGGER